MKYLIIIIFSVLIIGCGKNNTNNVTKLEGAPAPFDGSKKLHFALIRQALEGEFLQMWQTGSQKQADLMGIKLTVLGKNMDNQAQADFIYQAINMKVDGIILDNGFAETLTEPINEAVKLCTPKECVGFKRLGILVGKKLNKPLPKKDHLLYTDAQYVDYSLEDAIARNIETDKRDDRKSVFAPGVDISLLYEEVQSSLTRDNQLMVTEQDEYIVPHENIGYVGDEVANNIKVITVPGTTQIISLYPYTEPLLPTRKVIEDSFAKKVQGNVMIKKFNERFEKFAAKSSSSKND